GLGAGAGAGTGSGLASGFGGSEVAQPAANATATNTAIRFLVIRSPLISSCFFVFGESRVCVTLEGILPQVRELFQTGEGAWQQASLDHARFTAPPDVRDVLAAGGIDEMRHRVVAGRELGRAQSDGREVGGLSGDDRAGDRADAERFGA